MFAEQKKKRLLDRFDITILLLLYKKTHGELTMMQEYYQTKKNNEVIKKIGRFPVTYSLMIFDEFQNYLPQQIGLAKSTLDDAHNAVMYVGDIAQKTQFGTIQDWTEISESIPEQRKVMLHKVYRNTRQILEYIESLGYSINIDDNVRSGEGVIEKRITSKDEEIAFVKEQIAKHTGTVGILAKDNVYVKEFEYLSELRDNVHVLSIHEAQGVEFDMVCLVGVDVEMFETNYDEQFKKYKAEKQQMNWDLLYVGLTRAMNTLVISGSARLSEIMPNV